MSKTPDAEMNLQFAWAVLILGHNQHDVAALFNVNGGRVAEAVRAVRLAIADPITAAEMWMKPENLPETERRLADRKTVDQEQLSLLIFGDTKDKHGYRVTPSRGRLS